MQEKWKQVPGYEGLYEISSCKRVKSLVGWNGKDYYLREKIISPFKQKCVGGYRLVVKLTKDKKRTDFKVDKLFEDAFN